MDQPPHDFSEQVWLRTLPALRRRRLTRRAVGVGAGAATLLLALLAIALWTHDVPVQHQGITSFGTTPPIPAESLSLAVLIVDQSGARFQRLDAAELAGEGLTCQLTLDPVITGPIFGFP